MMTHTKMKMTIAITLLVAAVGYLGWAGASQGWVYYLEVDQFIAQPQTQHQRVRLAGKVAMQGVESSRALGAASFDLYGKTGHLPVKYQGEVPDMFKPGCKVVVEGKKDQAGIFQADFMMTKCASKYQAEDHAKRLEAGQ